MASYPIEVVEWDNTRGAKASLKTLTRKVFEEKEPGFQIDGVQNPSELYSVFDIVKHAMPFRFRRRFVINSLVTGLEPPKDGRTSTVPPHTDKVDHVSGIAIHQNIHGGGKLLLANLIADRYMLGKTNSVFEADLSQLKNVREGVLKIGGLTVFGEGGYGSMSPAIHFFDRRGYDDLDQWVRYGYSQEHEQTGLDYESEVLHLAQTAFALLSEKSNAA